MLLEDNVNLLLGRLIGLSNGIFDEEKDEDVIINIKGALKSIKENKDIDKYLTIILNDKKRLLPNCMICSSPCGRTSDYYLNEIQNDDLRNKKIKELEELLNNFESLTNEELLRKICVLSF